MFTITQNSITINRELGYIKFGIQKGNFLKCIFWGSHKEEKRYNYIVPFISLLLYRRSSAINSLASYFWNCGVIKSIIKPPLLWLLSLNADILGGFVLRFRSLAGSEGESAMAVVTTSPRNTSVREMWSIVVLWSFAEADYRSCCRATARPISRQLIESYFIERFN